MLFSGIAERACGTETPNAFGLDFSTAPAFLFYSYIPIIILSLIIGVFILRKDKFSIKSKALLAFISFFSLWILNILLQWISSYHTALMFEWKITVLLELGMFFSAIYFVYTFLYEKDVPFKGKLFFSAVTIIIALLLPSQFNIVAYDVENCEGIIGGLWSFMYALEPAILVIAGFLCFLKIKKCSRSDPRRQQIVLFGTGICSFLLIFFLSNFYGEITKVYEFNLWGPLGMLIFIAFLNYIIIKFKTFNTKVLATDILVVALWALIGSILFVAKTTPTRIVTASTEIIAIVFGIMLIKTVRKEVAQREELQQLTQELAQKNQKLQELDVQKSQFLSFASHDLKSPVNVIKQFASLILDKTYSTPEKIMETAQKIKSNAERAVGLVDDFLDLRRLEDGKMEYAFEKKNVVTLVHDIVEDFKVLAKQQKNIDVIFTSTRNEVLANLDVSRFSQVIQNLLSNSLKYTELGTIVVNIKDEQSTALIEVKDTGIGMSAELIPTLFEQFHRAPGAAKKIQGTGLGLYISKQIVLGHGGEIWVSSEGAGKGSSFFVRIKKA